MKSHHGTGMKVALPVEERKPFTKGARLEWERACIEEAREDIRMGRVLEGEAMEAWLRGWAAGDPLPEDEETADKAS